MSQVTLVVPWLSKVDQLKVFPEGLIFDTPEQQEEYVRNWVEKRTVSARLRVVSSVQSKLAYFEPFLALLILRVLSCLTQGAQKCIQGDILPRTLCS